MDTVVAFVSLPNERATFPVAGGSNLVLKRAEMLPARTLNAIERGHTKHGRLLFEIGGSRINEISSGAARMWIGCYDVKEKLYEAIFQAGMAHEAVRPYPDEETEATPQPPMLPSQ